MESQIPICLIDENYNFLDIFPQTAQIRKRLWIYSLARKNSEDIQPIVSSHGDSFFSEIGTWFENLDLGNAAPRSEEVIKESIIKSIEENPVFDSLRGDAEYLSILRLLRKSFGGKQYEK